MADGETGALRGYQRMPIGFGPTPGPRNLPADREQYRYAAETTTITITARTDRDALSALVPEALEVDERALLNVSIVQLRKLGWLAGRGYNIVALAIPVISRADRSVKGNFLPVLWENHPDPIITGREELGYPKVYAEIPDPAFLGNGCSGAAQWGGYEFFRFAMTDLEAQEPGATGDPIRTFTHKYIPKTFAESGADVSYLTSSRGAGETHGIRTDFAPDVKLVGVERGKGSFAFRHARWEDMPTQYHIVNRLADLPLHSFQGARIFRSRGQDDASGQHRFAEL